MPAPAVTTGATEPLVEVAGLRKLYPAGKQGWRQKKSVLHAVAGVDFMIGRGETVGLVGELGCGKTTLVRLLTRLIDPSGGMVFFEGREIGGWPASSFGRRAERAQIQMVFQDATDSLNPRFTAFRAIADPLRRLLGMSGKTLRNRVEELARLTGLPAELLGRFPHQLSGGQKARVGIARAIAVEPRLLVLDEPTSALDVSVQVLILQMLEDLKRRLGLSYLFVSHDLNVVRLLCDRILVMYLGRIVESGPADAVFAAPAHPYTRALLSAVPTPGVSSRDKRIPLPGDPRSPIDPDPNTCSLYGRCFKGTDFCTAAMPHPRDLGAGRSVACHFPLIEAAAERRSLAVGE